MNPDLLIRGYVAAARTAEHWANEIDLHYCAAERLHARKLQLLPAGSTCTTCRARIHAMHKHQEAKTRRNEALREQWEYVRHQEIQERREKHARHRARTGQEGKV